MLLKLFPVQPFKFLKTLMKYQKFLVLNQLPEYSNPDKNPISYVDGCTKISAHAVTCTFKLNHIFLTQWHLGIQISR